MQKLILIITSFTFSVVTCQAAYIPDLANKTTSYEIMAATISSNSSIDRYEALTGKRLSRLQKWVFNLSQKRFLEGEKKKFHFGGFLLGFLGSILGCVLAVVVLSAFGFGAFAIGLGVGLAATIASSYAFKNKNIGRSAAWGVLGYVATALLLAISVIIFLLTCDCLG